MRQSKKILSIWCLGVRLIGFSVNYFNAVKYYESSSGRCGKMADENIGASCLYQMVTEALCVSSFFRAASCDFFVFPYCANEEAML